jgi:amino acid adenylation domain-containing protein
MEQLAVDDRDFWRGVLATAGPAAVPRWTVNPMPGTAEYATPIPDDCVVALCKLVDGLGIPLGAAMLSAHAKVISALSGERQFTTGYVAAEGAQPLPCVLSTEADSWRGLLLDCRRSETDLLRHKEFPVTELMREMKVSTALFDTVVDTTGADADLAEDTALRMTVSPRGAELQLRLRYRTDAFDADSAARIAGYYLTALALMATEPDAHHGRQSLLSPAERRFQLDGLAGSHRELPDQRVHELFEARVRKDSDAIAAVHADLQWNYRELNSHANQLARALLAQGLHREDVVAVVAERNLDWMAAVLAIFKAGGAYLPIEPHFPADRIATTLSRADCHLVLTEPTSTNTLNQAVKSRPDVHTMFIDAAYEAGHPDDDLDVEVAPDQLAYIYFTSGSTGEPKGAMCEHAGMLNHMFAKIDDLDIVDGSIVAQTAPQCFDISLWQLLSALLVGAQTLIVEQDVILDVPQFVDKIVDGRVSVLQVVPSYLEAVVSHLERSPQKLADLRCVSVTGEALKKELAERWFAAEPDIKLINAYGLTETSDDTNHEVMDGAPNGAAVPLGRPVNNVRVYIVDEHLSPVPLGAPGAIVFSGVCVGRGYVNDPERTRLAFMADPHRTGERLYLGGDYGRWRPDGKLEFLGRRDSQVKINGFRIEIGEVENALLRVPGVRDGAVVIAERIDQSKHLVAFYSGARPLEVGVLRSRLAESLPDYMLPGTFHWRDSLPLTANGKIDKKSLTRLAGDLDVADDHEPPSTPTEQRLAAAWAKVLGVAENQIGRRDHFFDRGGTSLSAVKLAVTLNRAVSLKDVTQHPVLSDLAGIVDGRSDHGSALLQSLSNPDGVPVGVLVCFPYAGGNAVNFQPMAKALRDNGSGLAVYAVELPGHDVAAENEPFQPMSTVADRVVEEITRAGVTPVSIWGHSSGSALAIETARRLHERGIDVRHVFLAAQLLGDADERRSAGAQLTGRGDAEVAAELRAGGGYTELGELDAGRAEHVGAAYRHDCVAAHRYFVELLEAPPDVRLSVPVTVVGAADDSYTANFTQRYGDWRLLAEHVDMYEIPDGGHYFLRTRPAEAAKSVVRATELLASS